MADVHDPKNIDPLKYCDPFYFSEGFPPLGV
jgi:hypothetical protein